MSVYQNNRSKTLWMVWYKPFMDVNLDLPEGEDMEMMYHLKRIGKSTFKYVWQHELDARYTLQKPVLDAVIPVKDDA